MTSRRHIRPCLRHALVLGGLVASLALALPALAQAESCVYDPQSASVSASITPGGSAVLDVAGGAIRFGAVPTPCGGATTTNTDSISIVGNAGTVERLTLDQRPGLFGPGATAEFNIPEIEIATALGDQTDTVAFYLTEGDDFVAAGQFGFALNTDGDVDVTFSPSLLRLEVYALGGHDYVNGRGEGGAGLRFLGPMVIDGGPGNESLIRGGAQGDVLLGGSGNDRLEGQDGNDEIDGGAGDDFVSGGANDDELTGGSGSDGFAGSGGNDVIHAEDGEADSQINGGAGTDTASYDIGLDPAPIAVENVSGTPPPPPPPPPAGACVYDPATRSVSAQMVAGTQATLVVSGAEIRFGATPAACGSATTANTDTISIVAPSGSSETLTIDQSGGAFAPGATAESGLAEIEIATSLGDTSDRILVVGSAADDHVAVGQTGIALNADGDADVTFSPTPAEVQAAGLGGSDTLAGRGGQGTGGVFAGLLVLDGGDGADTLRGGSGADELHGGSGNDLLEGREGADTLAGDAGADTLAGNDGDDVLTGGAGADSFSGSSGNDLFFAVDGEADTQLNGGPGIDTAHYDAALDATPVAVENRFPE
ncbi:MAG TPA: calcium-binding protein [Gaiellaceae bacterium]|nr:calcium-binding protein [Gaiellaceae bacterium]